MPTRRRRVVLLPDRALVLVQRRERLDLHAEHVFFDVVRERLDLVRGVDVRRHGEHLVELLERERLRLGHEEQDEHEPDRVPRGVPPEGALCGEGAEEGREGDRDDEVAARESVSLCVEGLEGEGTYKNQRTAVEKDMPTARTLSGYASAEYVNGTGPSPGE